MTDTDDNSQPRYKETRLFIGGVADGRRIEVDNDAEWWKAEERLPLPRPGATPKGCTTVDVYQPFPLQYGQPHFERITVMAKEGMSKFDILAALVNGYRRETK